MSRVYLVRHAHAKWAPDEMRPLSREGRAQADRIADRLADVAPVAIYSSPYTRARQTVEPLALRLGLTIEEVSDLRERALSTGRLKDFEGALRASWYDFSLAYPGGESSSDAQSRAVTVHRTLCARHREDPVVVSTHGNLLALLLNYYDPSLLFDFWKSLSMPDVYLLALRSSGEAAIERRRD